MQLNPLSQETWRHGQHRAYSNVTERLSCLTLQEPSVSHLYQILSPGDRRSYLLDDSLSNPIQRESLAVPIGLGDSASRGQKQQQRKPVSEDLEEEEITPTDVKYRLQLLEEVPLRGKSSSVHSQYYRPGWTPFNKSQREWFKPWKMENVTHLEDERSYSSHTQSRRITPRGQQRHVEYGSQDQDAQPPVWSQALFPGLDKSSQGVIHFTQHMSREKEMVPGWPMAPAHQEMNQTKHGRAFVRSKKTAKFNEATTARGKKNNNACHHFDYLRKCRNTFLAFSSPQPLPAAQLTSAVKAVTLSQMPCLPPLKLEKKVKGRCPPITSGMLQGRLQSELTSKQFFQDWRAQPQEHFGSNEKLLAPFEDQVNTKVEYMPLFSERVKFVSPKTVASNLKQTHSQLSRKKQPGRLQNLASRREHLEKRSD